MWSSLAMLLRATALAQLCLPATEAALQPRRMRASDLRFTELLGFLANRYVAPGSTLVLCITDANTGLPWRHLQRQLSYVPVMSLCPGDGDGGIPPGRLVVALVAGAPQSLLKLMPKLSPATETALWYSDLVLVVRAEDEDGDDQEPLVRELMAIAWARSWVQTSVAVVGREWGTLYLMAPYANASGVCGHQAPAPVVSATVRMADRASYATLPNRLYGEDGFIPRDLGGCEIRASVVVGYEDRCGYTAKGELPVESKMAVSIMNSVAESRNARVRWRYIADEKTTDLGNGSFSGPLGELSKDADVVLGPLAMVSGRAQHLRATVSFLQIPIHIVARCPSLPQFQGRPRLWTIMFRSLWAAGSTVVYWSTFLSVCMWVTVLLRVAIARVSGVVPLAPGWWQAVAFDAMMSQFAMGTEVFLPLWRLCPRVTSSRVLTGAWLIFLLNINVVMKGLLLTESALNRGMAYPKTMAELLAAMPNLTVATPDEYMRLAVNSTGVPMERVVACENEQEVRVCEDRFARNSSFAVAIGTLPMRLKCLRGCRYSLPDVLVQANYVNYLKRTNVMVEMLDETIHRLHNGGLLNQMLNAEAQKRRYKAALSQLLHRRRHRHRSGFSSDSFIVFMVGQLVAAIAFLGEVAAHRLRAMLCPAC